MTVLTHRASTKGGFVYRETLWRGVRGNRALSEGKCRLDAPQSAENRAVIPQQSEGAAPDVCLYLPDDSARRECEVTLSASPSPMMHLPEKVAVLGQSLYIKSRRPGQLTLVWEMGGDKRGGSWESHVDPVISPVESAGPPLSDNQRGQAEGSGGRPTAP
ncbi:hypothetical protein EYF80_052154 [Liparis tanakae]|uniref:Uncharacterized protein n=1 Tax=Liparis tanakae TaxID=230148 RepID=A0A4Z2FA61_9TELE|nr:hypothetical protein EYF80_052154 [Liparis tanakae]